MEQNKIYFIQTLTIPGKRHCYVVSSPHLADAIAEIQDHWCDDDEEVITAERVARTYDADTDNFGKTVIKMHN